jgi:hypothetical protein
LRARTRAQHEWLLEIVNTPEMRVQKDYAFNLALLEIKQEAQQLCVYYHEKYTLRSVMFIQHVAILSPRNLERDARIFIILL